MASKTILIPLPNRDFDPTETSIPWKLLGEAGHQVLFAVPGPHPKPAEADPRMISGQGLGPWKELLRAREDARAAYEAMRQSDAFQHPIAYEDLTETTADGLLLPGGHAQGMKVYLESAVLQRFVASFYTSGRPVAAVCHGMVLAARSVNPATGRSILDGRRVTALPRMMEMSAWGMTCLWLGNYYRTYPESVQAEVTRALGPDGRFETGPPALRRDTAEHPEWGFTVRDGHLVTARWPGDIYRFTREFRAMLEA